MCCVQGKNKDQQFLYFMSSNRFKTIKPRLDEVLRKDLTPKSSKISTKLSPAYTSFRAAHQIKPDFTSKVRNNRPLTSKHANQNSQQYFHINHRDDSRNGYSSTKKMKKQQSMRVNHRQAYEYQPRSKSKSPVKQPDDIIRQQIYLMPEKFTIETRQIRHHPNDHKQVLPKVLSPISHFEKAKHSLKSNGYIKGYAASTNQGPVRSYNEDRVAIILNIPKPQHCVDFKKVAYFGVFDGHGGVDCADFLRDNLHLFVSQQKCFPHDIAAALQQGFDKCEQMYVTHSKESKVDKSGSCAIVTFFYGDRCYIANVGDSRAIMSSKNGKVISQLSVDHKASDEFEQRRIIEKGGKIYQTKLQNANPKVKILYEGEEHSFILGPHRVQPGRLSVTRTFGDIEAKLPQLGGNPFAIINEPEVRSIKIDGDQDFILLASDGIYDKMNNAEIIDMVWDTFTRQKGKYRTLHEFCGLAVENIMKLAFHKKTLDNITVVLVALEGLEKYFSQLDFYKQTPVEKSITQTRKNKGVWKHDSSFERKYIGRSTSPSNYSSLRSHSYYKN